MKLFDVDWSSVLHELGRWDALTLPARRVLLHELKTHGYVPAIRFEPHLAEIINSGIVVHEPAKHRLWLGDQRRALVKVLRAMGRQHLFHVAPQEVDPHHLRAELLRYMQEHFTGDEVQRIASAALRSGVYANRQTLAPFVAFPAWVGDLLAANDEQAILDWSDTHGLSSADYLSDASVLFTLQDLVRTLLDHPDGVPLRQLLATIDGDGEVRALASAIHAGLSSMVLFGGMRVEDLEPTIGLWPTVVRELMRPPARPPEPVTVGETFVLAWHMEDMTTLLATIASSPVRVRANDGAVFARTCADIERRLVVPPPWVAKFLEANRVDHASDALLAHAFVDIRDVDGNPHLQATPAGMHWLTLSAHDRLAALVEPMRRSQEKNPRDSYDIDRTASFFPYALPFYRAPRSLNLRADIVRAFLQARDRFIRVDAFVDYEIREDNPLSTQASSTNDQGLMFYSAYSDPRSSAREMWGTMLAQFLTNRLVAFGGATLGIDEAGGICFSLSDVGLYILGATDSFAYGADVAAGDVVVQPNFDLVFLGAAPAVEAELARFCERVGIAPGHVFRITRASVLAAAEAGAGVGDVIGALTRASSRPIPKNVQHEIAGWMSAVRRATLRRTELLECADADVAARVAGILGSTVRQLTPLVLELSAATPATRTSLLKKLRAAGVFITASGLS